MCNVICSGGTGRRITSLKPAEAKTVRHYLKNKTKPRNKRDESIAPVVEHMDGALGSIYVIEKKKNF
jgi:hypothetical protein